MRSAVAIAALSAGGCLIERLPQQRPAPRITVVVVAELGKGGAKDCTAPAAMEVVHGGVPGDARAVVKMTASASETMPLGALQDAMAEQAAPRCVHGLSVLRAVADDGARGVVEATAIAWVRVPRDAELDRERADDDGAAPADGAPPDGT
jgi:hypothetical protein